jgi:hypothetical protein
MAEEPFALSTIPPPPPVEGDYDAICATVRLSARGRWFLDEYARRNRNADTRLVLAAIERLETVVQGSRDREAYQSMRGDLLEMARTIAVTRAEVAESKAEPRAEDEPAAKHKPAAGSDVFAMAERIQDVAWTMRERGLDPRTCEQIEALAGTILSASALRDPNDHRTRKLGEVLQYLESRIDQMLEACANEASDYAPTPAASAAAEAEPLHTGNGYGNGHGNGHGNGLGHELGHELGNGHAAAGVDASADAPPVAQTVTAPTAGVDAGGPAHAAEVLPEAPPDPLPEAHKAAGPATAVAAAEGETAPEPDALKQPEAFVVAAELPADVAPAESAAAPAVLKPASAAALEPLASAQSDIVEPLVGEVAAPTAEPAASEVASAEPASAPMPSQATATLPEPAVAAISLPASELLPPADLDLPAPAPEPSAAEQVVAAEIVEPAAAKAQIRPALRPATSDLLAALMAMSDEERIALFT